MSILINKDKCVDCGVCTGLCAYNALNMTSEWTLKVTESSCVSCKECLSGCPTRALSILF